MFSDTILSHAKLVQSYDINNDKFERASMKFNNRSKDRRHIAKRADKTVVNLLAELMGIDERKELTDLIGNLKIPTSKK